jgi:hypothetical protein
MIPANETSSMFPAALDAALRGSSMQRDDAERWRDLCELAAREQDRQKLQALVLELTKLIEKEINARQREDAAQLHNVIRV